MSMFAIIVVASGYCGGGLFTLCDLVELQNGGEKWGRILLSLNQ